MDMNFRETRGAMNDGDVKINRCLILRAGNAAIDIRSVAVLPRYSCLTGTVDSCHFLSTFLTSSGGEAGSDDVVAAAFVEATDFDVVCRCPDRVSIRRIERALFQASLESITSL